MTTAPFNADTAKLLSQPHAQTFTAVAVSGATTIPLDLLDWSISWSDTRSPRVAARLECAVPDTQATIDLLDPRTLVRVALTAAYELPDGSSDAHQVADLHLRSREINRDDQSASMVLTLASDEFLVIDGGGPNPSAAGDATFTASNVGAAISQLINDILAGTPAASPVIVNKAAFTGPVALPIAPEPWNVINDAADQWDINVYDNGDRVFRIEPRPTAVGAASLTLQTGSTGTILRSTAGVDRDDWANWVSVWYQWTDTAGTDNVDGGYAAIASGPFAPASSGYKVLTEVRNMKGSNAAGNAAARAILRRMLARSRTYTIDAISAWWVRPGDTVTIQLPLGAQERHLVAVVEHRPGGQMTLVTRLPDTASTIGE